MQDVSSQPRIKQVSRAVEVQSLTHWTIKEVPLRILNEDHHWSTKMN